MGLGNDLSDLGNDLSDGPGQSGGATVFSPVTTAQVRAQCAAIRSMFDIVTSLGFDVDTDIIQPSIDACVSDLQQRRGILLQPQVIKTFPTLSDVLGVTYDMTDDQYDYITQSVTEASVFITHYRPIISVQQVSLQYSANTTVFTVPSQWLRVNKKMGRISIVPVVDPLLGGGGVPLTGYYMPLYSQVTANVVPNLVTIDYTAGIQNVQTDPQWAKLRMAIMRKASSHCREVMWELIPQSHSLDGVSDTFSRTETVAKWWDDGWDTFCEDFAKQNAPLMIGII